MPLPARSHQDFLIESLMPAREFHLVAGSSGVGKTKFTIQLTSSLESGEPFFGHPVHQIKTFYVCCDRGRDSFMRSLDAYSLPYDAFLWEVERKMPAPSVDHLVPRPAQLLDWVHKRHPEVQLVVLDGLSGLVKDICDYREVKAMVVACQDRCDSYNMAMIGTAHAAKIRTLDKICNPRERVLGTVAWGGFAEMVVSLDHEEPDNPENRYRIVNLCNHSGPGLRWRVVCDSRGQLVVADEDQDVLDILDASWPAKVPPEGASRTLFDTWAEEFGKAASRRVVDQWLARAVENGVLRRYGHTSNTLYFRMIPS